MYFSYFPIFMQLNLCLCQFFSGIGKVHRDLWEDGKKTIFSWKFVKEKFQIIILKCLYEKNYYQIILRFVLNKI